MGRFGAYCALSHEQGDADHKSALLGLTNLRAVEAIVRRALDAALSSAEIRPRSRSAECPAHNFGLLGMRSGPSGRSPDRDFRCSAAAILVGPVSPRYLLPRPIAG